VRYGNLGLYPSRGGTTSPSSHPQDLTEWIKYLAADLVAGIAQEGLMVEIPVSASNQRRPQTPRFEVSGWTNRHLIVICSPLELSSLQAKDCGCCLTLLGSGGNQATGDNSLLRGWRTGRQRGKR
jgi:hypothetical protein